MTHTAKSALRTAWQRALLSSVVVGGTTFLTTWATTDDPKVLTVATGTVVLGVIGARFGVEGYIDRANG